MKEQDPEKDDGGRETNRFKVYFKDSSQDLLIIGDGRKESRTPSFCLSH